MSQRKIPFAPGEFYHLYNRGNSRQLLFRDEHDHARFVELLFIANRTEPFNIPNARKGDGIYERTTDAPLVAIGAYCLMPNHFHILVTQIEENGISKFMQKLSTGYSMYFNIKYRRTGGLFEGKFKSQHASSDRQLQYLFSYIHLNPLKLHPETFLEQQITKDALQFLSSYEHSSFIDYLGTDRKQSKILNREAFPDYFPTRETFLKEVANWIAYRESVSFDSQK
jgi:putative transposase